MTKAYDYKQYSVDDWLEEIEASPTNLERSRTNLLIKIRGGHPLSSSEHCLLAAHIIWLHNKKFE